MSLVYTEICRGPCLDQAALRLPAAPLLRVEKALASFHRSALSNAQNCWLIWAAAGLLFPLLAQLLPRRRLRQLGPRGMRCCCCRHCLAIAAASPSPLPRRRRRRRATASWREWRIQWRQRRRGWQRQQRRWRCGWQRQRRVKTALRRGWRRQRRHRVVRGGDSVGVASWVAETALASHHG